jgi:hypothetical protein
MLSGYERLHTVSITSYDHSNAAPPDGQSALLLQIETPMNIHCDKHAA